MILSEQWLRTWLDLNLTIEEIADCLTMAGLEVSSIQPAAIKFEHVIVGEIKQKKTHPNSDTLFLYQVDVGQDECINIVSTISDLSVSQKLAVALEGAVLPSGKIVKKVTLEGVVSQGLFVSPDSLQLTYYSNQDLPLCFDPLAAIGQSVWDYLHLEDTLLDIELTPNRGDCLSVLGMVRELSALLNISFEQSAQKVIQPKLDNVQRIVIDKACEDDCAHYTGRVIKQVDLTKTVPIWLSERLRKSGIRSVNPIVDVMNYVMLELGQPMHAFDLKKIQGELRVRYANNNETITLLDGKSVSLRSGTLLIADNSEPLALAGIMGGLDSAVTETTQDIFIESAWFSPKSVSSAQRAYGIVSDSAYRFARGVDINLQHTALERATDLLLSIVGGHPGEVVELKIDEKVPSVISLDLDKVYLKRVLGIVIDNNSVTDILNRLGCNPKENETNWELTVPSYRTDIQQPIDIVEEIARVYGYNKIEAEFKEELDNINQKALKKVTTIPEQLGTRLVSLGYQEIITYSFIDEAKHNFVFEGTPPLKLVHPLSQEQSVMKTSGLIGLLDTVKYNQNRQIDTMKLFEKGMRFVPSSQGLKQENYCAAVMVGNRDTESWLSTNQKSDFYDIKGHLENILELIYPEQVKYIPKEYPMLHPGQSASIILNEKEIGFIGALHPRIKNYFGIKDLVFCFEVLFDIFKKKPVVYYQQVSKFPEIRRDIAVIIDEAILADEVIDVVKESAGELLRNTIVFDVYKGKGIPEGKKSIALALYLQHSMRTLVDEEINNVVAKVVKALEGNLQATMRE